ncbi:MAG: hypothetical protein U5L74_09110 [Ideonella sp.]|nr:hypothetical protein [Ideonella sp.]
MASQQALFIPSSLCWGVADVAHQPASDTLIATALQGQQMRRGAQTRIDLRAMEQRLRNYSALHRGVQQWVMAQQRLSEDHAQQ